MKSMKKNLLPAASLFAVFVLWTVAVRTIDVRTLGPLDANVGLAALNSKFHQLTGVHMSWYMITDWLSIIPLICAMGFGLLGLVQWIKRKYLRKVDFDILALGGFYLAVMAMYALFEKLEINYRPVLIDGILEASYPSSTTMLVLCVMTTAAMQVRSRLKKSLLRQCVLIAINVFTAFMVLGRTGAGVHWLTDIVGAALISAALITLYTAVCSLKKPPYD